MGRIAVLSQTLINQIAAGEVIVRPASVVKELVENSIDAGATRITILISPDARSITVIDDGCGMDRDDVELSLQRHATSKIKATDDLSRIDTRGFRGEAVPSIASVARVEILSRPKDALSGTRAVVEGGRIEQIASAGCPTGTRFEVRDLFYNTPARLKFLKSPRTEINTILQIVTQQALSQPGTGWVVEVEGRKVIDVPPGQTLRERAIELWGGSIGEGLFDVAAQRHDIAVHGVLGLPRIARRDRRNQIFFVNLRPIVSRTLSSALTEAYRGLLMVNRHPVAALFIDIHHELVDVNVHPTKEEVRFRDERSVAGSLFRIVEEALRGTQLVPMLSVSGEPGPAEPIGVSTPVSGQDQSTMAPKSHVTTPGFFQSPDTLARPGALRKPPAGPPARPPQQIDWLGAADALGIPPTTVGSTVAPGAAETTDSALGVEPTIILRREATTPPDSAESVAAVECAGPPTSRLVEPPRTESLWERFGDAEPLGQVARTYIVAAFGEGMLLVDQHAAHERLLFLRLQEETRASHLQNLLIPLTIDLAIADIPQLQSIRPFLQEMGIEIEEFGGSTFAIHTVPSDLEGLDVVSLIQDLVETSWNERGKRAPARELRERIQARMACRAAIKAGQRLSIEEMRRLLSDLRKSRMAFTCPHGRPTMTYLSRRELDRQFKRIV